jgi:hypothetical protein
MTTVLVDSNVLLDVPSWLSWSAEAIEQAADRYRLVINPVIYAEVSIRYSRIEELDAALPKTMFDREAIPYAAAFLVAKSFLAYRRRGGTKRSPLPHFFIGASPRPGAFGAAVLRNLGRYEGRVYPVNARYREIGELVCSPSIGAHRIATSRAFASNSSALAKVKVRCAGMIWDKASPRLLWPPPGESSRYLRRPASERGNSRCGAPRPIGAGTRVVGETSPPAMSR